MPAEPPRGERITPVRPRWTSGGPGALHESKDSESREFRVPLEARDPVLLDESRLSALCAPGVVRLKIVRQEGK